MRVEARGIVEDPVRERGGTADLDARTAATKNSLSDGQMVWRVGKVRDERIPMYARRQGTRSCGRCRNLLWRPLSRGRSHCRRQISRKVVRFEVPRNRRTTETPTD